MSKNQESLEYLKSVVGEYNFDMICIAMTGQRMTFPQRQNHINIEQRNRKIKHDYWSGMTPGAIAIKYDLSVSQIYKIIEGRH